MDARRATARAAEAAEPPLSAELSRHAAEEGGHVSLWDDFGAALGTETDRPARPETAALRGNWRLLDGVDARAG